MFLPSRDQAMDIVMSINMGADNYMTKPFEPGIGRKNPRDDASQL